MTLAEESTLERLDCGDRISECRNTGDLRMVDGDLSGIRLSALCAGIGEVSRQFSEGRADRTD